MWLNTNDKLRYDWVIEPSLLGDNMIEIQPWWKELVGKTFEDATAIAESYGWSLRASTVDGQRKIVTQDFNRQRLNVSIQDGIVLRGWKVG